METTGGGTAVLIALAAVLWMVYLIPIWRRRREYLATERSYRQIMQEAGVPTGFYDQTSDFTKFLASDISPAEPSRSTGSRPVSPCAQR